MPRETSVFSITTTTVYEACGGPSHHHIVMDDVGYTKLHAHKQQTKTSRFVLRDEERSQFPFSEHRSFCAIIDSTAYGLPTSSRQGSPPSNTFYLTPSATLQPGVRDSTQQIMPPSGTSIRRDSSMTNTRYRTMLPAPHAVDTSRCPLRHPTV